MRAIITVLDSINPTTMPYNEFILFRNEHYSDEKQILLLTGNEIIIPEEQIPKSLEIYKVGKNPFRIRKVLKALLRSFQEENMQYVIHLHSIRGSFSVLLAGVGLSIRKHCIYTIHSTFYGYRVHNKVLSAFNAIMANYVTCVSKTSYEAFPRIIRQMKKTHMMPLQNGVNTERIDKILNRYNEEGQKTQDCIKFVYVARMVPLKNHKFLIDVIDQVIADNVKFIFIGEEEDVSVKKYAQEKGVVDRIEFTGLLPREQVYSILSTADVYMSSSTLEGLPVSVLEGMYCGLPALLSDIPQHKELAGKEPGIRVLKCAINEWIEAIAEFVLIPEKTRKAMGKNCKDYVKKQFSLEGMHRKYDNIYEKVQ